MSKKQNNMTQEESKQKKVCVKCKWCKQEAINHQNWVEYMFKCTNHIVNFDTITGDETYMDCINKNQKGDCEMFETIKRPWYDTFFEKIFERKNEINN